MKKFIEMSCDEAFNFIWKIANLWNELYNENKVENMVFGLIIKWNEANPDKHELFGCEVDDPNVNNGYVCGIMIEDDVMIFREYREEYYNRY